MIKPRGKAIIVILALVVTVAAVAAAWVIPYFYDRAGVKAMVRVSPGMTFVSLKDSLDIYCNEGFADRVVRVMSWMDVDLSSRCGAYKIAPEDNPFSVARRIRNREQTPVKLTFNNIRLKEQFAQRVSQRLMMPADDLIKAMADSAVCSRYGKSTVTIVNILLPDTYEVYWDITPEELLDRMYGYYMRFWDESRVKKAKAIGLSPDEVQVLASIVEEETARADERGMVARLYLNRLDRGMMLQADPTVKYAIGDFSIRRITNAMLATPSPYNTYLNVGLPPGPIRISSKQAIDAVLNAPKHDYLYMCAKEDFSGYHNFTASYSQHLSNARRYQAELNRRGIK